MKNQQPSSFSGDSTLNEVMETIKLPDMRLSPRLSFRATVTGKHASTPITGHTEDLSHGGMFVHTVDVVQEGALVRFRIEVGPEAPVAVNGRVVRVLQQPQGLAVAFLADSVASERLSALIRNIEHDQRRSEEMGPFGQRQRTNVREAPTSGAVLGARLELVREQERLEGQEAELRSAHNVLQQDRRRLEKEIGDARSELLAERAQWQEHMERERKLMRQVAVRKTAAKGRLKEQLDRARQECDTLKRANGLLEGRCKLLAEEAATLRANRDKRGAHEEEIEREATERENRFRDVETELRRQLEDREQRLTLLMQAQQESQKSHEVERDQLLDHARQRVQALSSEVERSKEELVEAKSHLELRLKVMEDLNREQEEVIEGLHGELAAAKAAQQELTETRAHLQLQTSAVEQRAQEQEDVVGRLHEELTETQTHLQLKMSMVEELSREVEQLQEELTAGQTHVELKTSVVEQLERELAEAQTQLLNAGASGDWQREVEQLQEELTATQAHLQMKASMVDELQQELETVSLEASAENEVMVARVSYLESEVGRLQVCGPPQNVSPLGPQTMVDESRPLEREPALESTFSDDPQPFYTLPQSMESVSESTQPFYTLPEGTPVPLETQPAVQTVPTQPAVQSLLPMATEPVITQPMAQTMPMVTEPVITIATEPVITQPMAQTMPIATEPVITQPMAQTMPIATEPVVTQPMAQTMPMATEPVVTQTEAQTYFPVAEAMPEDSGISEEQEEQNRRWTDSADPDDLRYLGFGRRLSSWVERTVARFAPGHVDLDDIPDWKRDDEDY
ncbi:PilZ domain-containing protein [Myxococcota bacterium]